MENNLKAIYRILKESERLSMETPIDSEDGIETKDLYGSVSKYFYVEPIRFSRLIFMLMQADILDEKLCITLKGLEYLYKDPLMLIFDNPDE